MKNRILVVDDDDMYRAMLKKFFTQTGYDVTVAENGKEALKRQMENPSPIILTDIVMPEMEGIQTIVEFRRTYPGVKIIAVSGGGRISPDQYLLMATKLGAHRVFSKPFKTSELLAAVEELLAE
jgi:DNA-binding response OmpR family regulator